MRLFSNVWSENTALFERLMEIHSNSPKLYYGFNSKWVRNYTNSVLKINPTLGKRLPQTHTRYPVEDQTPSSPALHRQPPPGSGTWRYPASRRWCGRSPGSWWSRRSETAAVAIVILSRCRRCRTRPPWGHGLPKALWSKMEGQRSSN